MCGQTVRINGDGGGLESPHVIPGCGMADLIPMSMAVAEMVLTKQPHEYLDLSTIPDYFDWRDVNGMSLTRQSFA